MSQPKHGRQGKVSLPAGFYLLLLRILLLLLVLVLVMVLVLFLLLALKLGNVVRRKASIIKEIINKVDALQASKSTFHKCTSTDEVEN